MARQLKQILMWWPNPNTPPIMQMTWARNPLEGVKAEPDRIIYGWSKTTEIVVYYWGCDMVWDFILEWGYYAKPQF